MPKTPPRPARFLALGTALGTALGSALGCASKPAGAPAPAAIAATAAPAAPTVKPAGATDTVKRNPVTELVNEFQAVSAPMLATGNYLGIVQQLEKMSGRPGLDSNVRSMTKQLLGTYATFVGQQQEALEAFSFGRRAPVPFDSAALSRFTAEDAADAVARLAAGRQAVFINEAHHVPRHRAFTASVLPKLRAMGFSYLAVETLSDKDTALNSRKYPVRETGFYSNEPAFGEMLRTALKLGFTLVPYEAMSSSQDQREMGQAQHIVDRILRADPKARIVVHAGYDHINESGTLDGAKPMAVRFHELTGIDPLTVDQTVMTEQADTTEEDSRYLFLTKRVRRQTPFVLRSADSVWSARPGVHDVTVIHPHAVNRAFRPGWLWAFGNRRAYLLSDEVCGTVNLDCVVTARIDGESDDAVPIDVLRIQFSAPGSKTFALPPGRYVIEARDGLGATLSKQTVTVGAR